MFVGNSYSGTSIFTKICRSMQVDIEAINRNGPLTITLDFLKLKLCFKFPFYLICSHILVGTILLHL